MLRKKQKLATRELIIFLLLLWLLLPIQSLRAEIVQINENTVQMTVDDLRDFVKQSEELRILKESNNPQSKKVNYYLGGNVGTYGIGISCGVIW